jgi:hypothetical protein
MRARREERISRRQQDDVVTRAHDTKNGQYERSHAVHLTIRFETILRVRIQARCTDTDQIQETNVRVLKLFVKRSEYPGGGDPDNQWNRATSS